MDGGCTKKRKAVFPLGSVADVVTVQIMIRMELTCTAITAARRWTEVVTMPRYIKQEDAIKAMMAAKWVHESDGAMAMEIIAS